ncbi:hypothetical protein IscW_ISCW009928 [Ixodes scapularis]|uniref:C2H2-type domain-containing protein n=1 Tax=Ixodes scapularis TaxID=6945 RepID=B7Q1C0_IXOSC|nr:hypothetical protein IscW_ISCW009928 [Ixodes scapularis]|eukprot:XP_002409297.1 hypothetical protein IscW_ISCW009928 [Ixodes scapularis]
MLENPLRTPPIDRSINCWALTAWRGGSEPREGEEERGRWLCQLPPARDSQEQNVEVVAHGGQIQLRATRTGEKTYRCPLCSDLFSHPHPVISHLMYRCPARHHAAASLLPPSPELSPDLSAEPGSNRKPALTPEPRRVKGFDIASLTDTSLDLKGNPARVSLDSSKSPALDYSSSSSLPDDLSFKRPTKKRKSDEDNAPASSAFKKVDKTDRSPGLSPIAGGFPFAFPYSLPSSSPICALSLPSQNWCAKCQTSFRMTSDLVYHMRSHHKRETDPAKKRREDKLRCHICHESFRERHHLTRHMTSHQ